MKNHYLSNLQTRQKYLNKNKTPEPQFINEQLITVRKLITINCKRSNASAKAHKKSGTFT